MLLVESWWFQVFIMVIAMEKAGSDDDDDDDECLLDDADVSGNGETPWLLSKRREDDG